jgi:GntR family transcriptional regulator
MEIDRIKEKGLTEIVKNSIYQYIKTIDLDQSTKLPREELLAEQLGVSRVTVRSALKELATEGIIFSRQGKGTFINKEALQMKVSFNPIQDLRNVITNSGYRAKIATINLETRYADNNEADKLQISKEDKLVVIERIFYADDHPAVYCIDRIPLRLFKEDVSYEDSQISIFEYIKHNLGKTITWDKVELSTVTNTENKLLNQHFKVEKCKSFLNCDIINYDQDDEPIFYANEYIDTNFIRFNAIRQKKI